MFRAPPPPTNNMNPSIADSSLWKNSQWLEGRVRGLFYLFSKNKQNSCTLCKVITPNDGHFCFLLVTLSLEEIKTWISAISSVKPEEWLPLKSVCTSRYCVPLYGTRNIHFLCVSSSDSCFELMAHKIWEQLFQNWTRSASIFIKKTHKASLTNIGQSACLEEIKRWNNL